MPDVPEKHTEPNANEAEEVDVDDVVDGEIVDDEGASPEDVEDAASDEADVDDLDASEQALDKDIQRLVAERDQHLEDLQRVQADFKNYQKQVQKRLDNSVAVQLGEFVEQRLLPVLDACDAAVAQGSNEAVEPIVTALYGALEKEGLERIDPKGESFDPEVAEAVLHDPGEGGEQVVAEVMRTGYRWKGRLLRPALVKVTD